MYAISDASNIYHLLYPGQDYTLCGFRSEKIDSKSHQLALHTVEVLAPDRELCKQCDKMDQRRKQSRLG